MNAADETGDESGKFLGKSKSRNPGGFRRRGVFEVPLPRSKFPARSRVPSKSRAIRLLKGPATRDLIREIAAAARRGRTSQ